MKWLEYNLNCCPLSFQLDLFNLGDKYLSDLVLRLLSVYCSLMEFFSVFPCVTAGVLAEQESVFLSKNHVIALPSTCVSAQKVCVCVGCSAVRLDAHAQNKAMRFTCVLSSRSM